MKTTRGTPSPALPPSGGRLQIGSSSTPAKAAPTAAPAQAQAPAQAPQSKPTAPPAAEASRYEAEAKPQHDGLSTPSKAQSPQERSALNTRTSTLGYGKSSSAKSSGEAGSAPESAASPSAKKKSPEETADAVLRGAMSRRMVQVKSEGPGIIHTRIRKGKEDPKEAAKAPEDKTRLQRIQDQMQHGAVYDKVTVEGGAKQGDVLGTKEGEQPEHPAKLAERAPHNSAVINGGFFTHMEGILDHEGKPIEKTGIPVGPTSTRSDHTPIVGTWKDVYGQVKVNDQVGLSAGPMLSVEGKKQEGLVGERFSYRPGPNGEENPLNAYAGALTHTDENNERSALTVAGDNAVMHTLTAKGVRTKGATMEQWQNITSEVPGKPTTLNLDGGGSVYSAVRKEDGTIKQLSRGGKPTKDIRPVANVVMAQAQELPSSKEPGS